MVSVALARPLWWVACRSLRFLTGLVLMALLLGTSGTPAVNPGAGNLGAHRNQQAARAGAEAARAGAEPAPAGAGQELPTADGPSVHSGWSRQPGRFRAAVRSRQPAADVLGSAARPRAPPPR